MPSGAPAWCACSNLCVRSCRHLDQVQVHVWRSVAGGLVASYRRVLSQRRGAPHTHTPRFGVPSASTATRQACGFVPRRLRRGHVDATASPLRGTMPTTRCSLAVVAACWLASALVLAPVAEAYIYHLPNRVLGEQHIQDGKSMQLSALPLGEGPMFSQADAPFGNDAPYIELSGVATLLPSAERGSTTMLNVVRAVGQGCWGAWWGA